MNYAGRLQRLRDQLGAQDLDALLVTHQPNIRYLTGFTGSAAALLVYGAGAAMFTDGRYRTQAHAEVRDARIVIGKLPPLVEGGLWLAQHRSKLSGRARLALGIEAESLTLGSRRRLVSSLGKGFRLKEAPQLVERLRMIKDADEIRLMRAAAELGASLFQVACAKLRPGVTENAVAAGMEYEARMKGAEGMAFSTIIASGKRSALVHGRASSQIVSKRGFVVCDFGVILAGYCSDRTRSVHVGSPSREAKGFYGAVLEAQLAGLAAVRPGVRAAEVDAEARKSLRRSKLARYFSHSTGHGVGLEIHEAPRLAAVETEVLRPGMVITIEPGAYVPGKWGVRIEDTVVVTENGCEVLAPSDKQLIVLN